jgi:hypothetical protein
MPRHWPDQQHAGFRLDTYGASAVRPARCSVRKTASQVAFLQHGAYAALGLNRAGRADYPLTTTEVRSVLRRAGNSSLSSFAQRLATQMKSATSVEKATVWSDTVGPVFRGAWPLDVELQTSMATFRLVQILLATGSAFGDAATAIIPFIRSESQRQHTSIYSISEAGEELYAVAPEKMLSLLSAIAGDAPDRSLFGLAKALKKLKAKAPQLAHTKAFQKLQTQAMPN